MTVKYQDYYKLLGVSRTAGADKVQRAFRKLARKYHPDVNKDPAAAGKFTQINEAYEVLKDPKKRESYDTLGENWKAGQDFTPPPGWENYDFDIGGRPGAGRPGGSAGGPGFSFSSEGFSNFFDLFFNQEAGGHGGGGFATPRRPPAREIDFSLTLEEACHGGTRRLALQGPDGERSLEVNIPPGAVSGSKIRLKGQGGGGADLMLKVRLRHHDGFEVHGHNLTVNLPLSPWEAALGAKLAVKTVEGQVSVTVPPGTGSGQRLRVAGHGLPNRDSKRGDLFVRVRIVVPKTLTDEERRLLEQLRDESKFEPRA